MRFSKVSVFGLSLLSASLGFAAPVEKRQAAPLTDLDILQFALTLEHLEATFYAQGFANFTDAEFMAAGLSAQQLSDLKEVGQHEATHVTTLQSVITAAGGTPVEACTYAFGVTSPQVMLATARVLEAVGVSAYLGAAPLVTSKDVLVAAAEIVTVEARHQTFIRTALMANAVPTAFDTPQDPRSVFTLAGAFITSCPSGSSLSIQPFASLTVNNAAAIAGGDQLIMSGMEAAISGASEVFCSFTSDATTMFSPFSLESGCTVPMGLAGEVYLVLSSNGTAFSDDTVLAGPAVLSFS